MRATVCVNLSFVMCTRDSKEIVPWATVKASFPLQTWYRSNFSLLIKVIMIANNKARVQTCQIIAFRLYSDPVRHKSLFPFKKSDT